MTNINAHHSPQLAPIGLLRTFVLLSVVSGCGSQADLPMENLGNTSDNLGGVTQQPEGKARFSGRWVGQAEEPLLEIGGESVDYTFPSGSRDVTLELLFDEDAFISGSIVFGAGTPPAPVAGESYPQGVEHGLAIVASLPPVEGYAYELHEQTLDFGSDADEVATLSYEQFGAFAQWCPLQPSLAHDGRYDCLGMDYYGGTLTDEGYVCFARNAAGATANVDCNLATLCGLSVPCSCDAGGCSQRPSPLRVFLELRGDELTASFAETMVDVGLPEYEPEQLKPLDLQRVAP